MVNPIPSDYPRVTPYLIVDGAAPRSTSTSRCSAPTERMRMAGPTARLVTPSSPRRLGDHARRRAPRDGRPRPEDRRRHPGVAARLRRGLRRRLRARDRRPARGRCAPVEDQFYGDRSGSSRTRSDTAGTSPRTSRTSATRGRCPSGVRTGPRTDLSGHRRTCPRPGAAISRLLGSLARGVVGVLDVHVQRHRGSADGPRPAHVHVEVLVGEHDHRVADCRARRDPPCRRGLPCASARRRRAPSRRNRSRRWRHRRSDRA